MENKTKYSVAYFCGNCFQKFVIIYPFGDKAERTLSCPNCGQDIKRKLGTEAFDIFGYYWYNKEKKGLEEV